MTVQMQPFPAANFRAFDANGVPLSGGLLFAYSAGTSNPLATYTDSTGSTANSNPVVLDATGTANIWLQPGLGYKFVLQNSLGVVQWTVDNYISPPGQNSSNSASAATVTPGGRVSVAANQPVPSADQLGQAVAYYLPYLSDQVPIFDGTNWSLFSIGTGISQAASDNTKSPAAAVANKNYDLFAWNDAGTIRISRGPPWSSDTVRGAGAGTTEIALQNGKLVNVNSIANGPGAKLGAYIGTVRTDGSALFNDAANLRGTWNCYNRRSRYLRAIDATGGWTYSAGVWRQANANSANQVNFVCGLAEDLVEATATSFGVSAGGAGCGVGAGIGYDSITAPVAGGISALGSTAAAAGLGLQMTARFNTPALGFHYFAWLEIADGTNNTLFQGAGSFSKCGMVGSIQA